METLENLKNTYAQEHGYQHWTTLVYEYGEENSDWHDYGKNHPNNFNKHMDEICIRAQKAALEKKIEIMKSLRSVYDVGSGQHNILSLLINEFQNPENLIR